MTTFGSRQLNLLQGSTQKDSNQSPQEPMSPAEDISPLKDSDSSIIIDIPEMLLIIDTETTGLNPKIHKCLEVGAILFHVQSRSIIAQQSFLLPVESNLAESINHIPHEITCIPQPWKEAINYFRSLLRSADVLVAHNAAFDKEWFGLNYLPEVSKPWLCTMEDIRWPNRLQLRSRPSVRDLALAYEVPVWKAHRALTDCIYLAEVLSRCEDLEALLEKGLEPRRLMKANISYEQRHMAKEAGFRWDNPVKKTWTKRLSEREISELPFSVEELEE